MASAQRFITPEETDVLSFLHQNIARKLEIESQTQGLAKTHPRVIRAVIQHFNLGPTLHRNFDHLVWAIARCSDITNTLVGISGETGLVARISCFIE